MRLAEAVLPLSRGGAQSVRLQPERARCAAVAARVSAACALLSCARLRAPQDRSRDVLQLWPRSWRLRTPTARALHEYVRLVWLACGAVTSAGAPFVRPAVLVIARVISTVRRIAPSAMASHGCSSTSHVRFICCPVDTAQNIVSGKLARPHLIRD